MRIVGSINRLPQGSKILLEGLSVEPDVWIAINLKVEQTLDRRTPRWRIHLFNAGTLAAFLAALGVAFLLRLPAWAGAPAAVLVLALWIVLMRWVHANTRRSIRWEVMARRGLPICGRCGYNLTALASDRCPECGGAISEMRPENND